MVIISCCIRLLFSLKIIILIENLFLLVMLTDYCKLVMSNYLLFRDFVLMVENENIDDNDWMMLVMEMYEVYVDVGETDQVFVVVMVVVADDDELAVDIVEYYVVVENEKIVECVVVVDNEMLPHVDGEIKVQVSVVDEDD